MTSTTTTTTAANASTTTPSVDSSPIADFAARSLPGAHAARSRRARRLGPGSPDPALAAIREKVERGDRLSLAEGEALYETPDIWSVVELAASVRDRLHPGVAYYNVNRHMNYSNVCALSCKFCEFYRKKDQPGAYTKSLDEVRAEAQKALDTGATEMHIVGGLHPYLPFDYYPDMLRAIKEVAPDLHLKAFTAVEIVHLAKIAKVYKRGERREGIRWVLQQLKDAGLGSLPGGGAEVFDDRIHDQAYKGKIRSDVWLDVHRVAHQLGLNSNCTILYGHIEQRRERLVHMEMLRRVQDQALAELGFVGAEASRSEGSDQLPSIADIEAPEITLVRDVLPSAPAGPLGVTQRLRDAVRRDEHGVARAGYFQTIIPLPFFPDGSELEHLPGPSGLENLRTLAVARLMLDNFPHVKAFWIMQTLKMAQLMLQCGADDIDGTVVWYDITKVGGAGTHQEVTVPDLHRAIREAGYDPVERDTLYRRVERDGRAWRVPGV